MKTGTRPPGAARRTEPTRALMDPKAEFKYVRSEATDIRKTFIKARKQ